LPPLPNVVYHKCLTQLYTQPTIFEHVSSESPPAKIQVLKFIACFLGVLPTSVKLNKSSSFINVQLVAPLGLMSPLHKMENFTKNATYCSQKGMFFEMQNFQQICDHSIYFNLYSLHNVGRDSSVGIATGYEVDGPGIESRWGRDFPHPSRPAVGSAQPPIQ
jgi:hypothetical protein